MRWPTDVRWMDACFNHGLISTNIHVDFSLFITSFLESGVWGPPHLSGSGQVFVACACLCKGSALAGIAIAVAFCTSSCSISSLACRVSFPFACVWSLFSNACGWWLQLALRAVCSF